MCVLFVHLHAEDLSAVVCLGRPAFGKIGSHENGDNSPTQRRRLDPHILKETLPKTRSSVPYIFVCFPEPFAVEASPSSRFV